MDKLRHYLDANGLTPIEFGARIGARSQATVYRYLAGTRRPAARMQRRIAEVTAGAVMPNDWIAAGPAEPSAEAA